MAKILGILTVFLLAFTGFFYMQNKTAHETEVATYDKALQKEVATKKELKKQTYRLKSADEERQLKEDKTVKVKAEIKGIEEKTLEKKKVFAALVEKHADLKAEYDKAMEETKDLPDPDEFVPKVKKLIADTEKVKSAISENEARVANLTELDKNGKATIKAANHLSAMRNSGNSFPTLKTHIASIYKNWGFVVLAAGDNEGVISGSMLDVVRGGEVIAKLKVTAVEAGRSSADIVLDSIAEGVSLRLGDRVVATQQSTKEKTAVTSVSR